MIAPLVLVIALAAASSEDVVARVDGVAVTRATLVRRMEAGPGRVAAPEAAIEQVVNDILLAAEGRRMGLASAPDVTAQIRQQTRSAAAGAMIGEIAQRADIKDQTLREMFHSQVDLASFDVLFYASREDAQAALTRLRGGAPIQGEAPRALVANVNPKPSEAPPSMRAEIDSALATALFAAAPGQLVGPVEARNGFAVGRLLRKEIGTDEQFRARRPALLRHARKQLETETRKHLGEQLRAGAAVKLDEAFLRSLEGLEATPKQLDHVIAIVGGDQLRYRDIYPSLRVLGGGHMAGPGPKISLAWVAIEERLIEAMAVERGYASSPRILALRPHIEQAALAAAAVARIQSGVPPPSKDETKAFYERNRRTLGPAFDRARAAAAEGAAAEKRLAAINRRLGELRAKASMQIDRQAVSRTTAGDPS